MSGEAAAGPIVVSVHDVSPGTAAQTMRRLADLDARASIGVTLLGFHPQSRRAQSVAGSGDVKNPGCAAGRAWEKLGPHVYVC